MPPGDAARPSNGGSGRSARYPGLSLGEAVRLSETIAERGLDDLPATALAEGLGFSNVRTNRFSAGLSSARQFGLLTLRGDRYALTTRARSIMHPSEPSERLRAAREALREPPLYARLIRRFAGRRLPDVGSLGSLLQSQERITAAARITAAEAFVDSARFAGMIDAEGVLRDTGLPSDDPEARREPAADPLAGHEFEPSRRVAEPARAPVRIDLRLWGRDEGKTIRVRAPETISPESFERLLAALRLHIRIEEDDRAS